MSIYEKAFEKSDKTDAVLVVDGKKLHVNKGLLSYHSDYFKTLFNSDFKEKSMEEIEIKDIKFEDFVTLLSLLNDVPLPVTEQKFENLLQLADRFLLPIAKRQVELYICATTIDKYKKAKIADTYNLENLLNHVVQLFKVKADFNNICYCTSNFSDRTKVKLFQRFFTLFPIP